MTVRTGATRAASKSRAAIDLRLALRVATMYHLEGATQAHIATRLGVSRPTVGRLLARARAEGLVTVEVHVPPDLRGTVNTELEQRLEDTFGLLEAIVVSDPVDGTNAGYTSLGRAGASALARRLHPADTLGFTWGPETIAIAQALKSGSAQCSRVVQLDGSMTSADYQTGVEFTLGRCADVLQARPVRLIAPLYADPATVSALHQDTVISQAIRAGAEADTMMFGIGPVSTSTTLFEGNFIDTAVLAELEQLGAVGEIGGRFFRADGSDTEGSLPDRTVSVGLDAIRACEHSMLVSGGPLKHEAILGALRGRLATVLVTDVETAAWLLSHHTEGAP